MNHPDPPRIVSVTLAGNAAPIIGDALRSVVDWVDACLVVDTGGTDGTLEIARAIAGAKYREWSFAWIGDFAAARNAALHAAAALGARWALMLDTDERIELCGVDILAALEASGADVLHVADDSGAYDKQRFFRLPARGRYVGRTHEYFETSARVDLLPRVRFGETPKTPEAYRAKFERDVAMLELETREFPGEARWFYYLGESYRHLARYHDAIVAYTRCAELSGWDEEAAWSCFHAAECWIILEAWEEAVLVCARGLAHHPGVGELAWLAAYACWRAGQPERAVSWAHMAIALGCFDGEGRRTRRYGFRHPPGLWEGPYDVLRFALRDLGDDAEADAAEELFQMAKAARENAQP